MGLMWNQITINFRFQDLWSPVLIFLLILFSVIYLVFVGPLRHRFPGSKPVPAKKQIAFLLGLLFLYISFGSPLYVIGHLMFSVHMVQMAFSYLIAPLLLLYGIPGWLLEPWFFKKPVSSIVKFITKPVLAILLFNAVFQIYHLPFVFDTVMTNYTIQKIFESTLFIAAVWMWWPVFCPIQKWDRLTYMQKVFYIYANGALLTPACALLAFSRSPVYETYSNPEVWAQALSLCIAGDTPIPKNLFQTFSPLSPLLDQQAGGVIMKVIQEIVYGFAVIYTVILWVKEKKENKKDFDPYSVSPLSRQMNPKREH